MRLNIYPQHPDERLPPVTVYSGDASDLFITGAPPCVTALRLLVVTLSGTHQAIDATRQPGGFLAIVPSSVATAAYTAKDGLKIQVRYAGQGEWITFAIADFTVTGDNPAIDVVPGIFDNIADLPDRYTDADVKAKISEIIAAGKSAAATLCAAILVHFAVVTTAPAATLDVQTARKDALFNDANIVTNVTLDVSDLATTTELDGVANNLANATNELAEAIATKADLVKIGTAALTLDDVWICGWDGTILRNDPSRTWSDEDNRVCAWVGTNNAASVWTQKDPTIILLVMRQFNQEFGLTVFINTETTGEMATYPVVVDGVDDEVYCDVLSVTGERFDATEIDYGCEEPEIDVSVHFPIVRRSYVSVAYSSDLAEALNVAKNELASATNGLLRTERDPTIYAWAKASAKPSYTPNEIFKDAANWIGEQGKAGRIIKLLAETIGGVIMGGYQVTASTMNNNNTTTYAYSGVAVKRDGANEDYMWDAVSTNGIVRRGELSSLASLETLRQATNALTVAIVDAKNAAITANEEASYAHATALTAQNSAEHAQSSADNANANALSAQSMANLSLTTASNALTATENALTASERAINISENALAGAISAQEHAAVAETIAQSAMDSAYSAARDASQAYVAAISASNIAYHAEGNAGTALDDAARAYAEAAKAREEVHEIPSEWAWASITNKPSWIGATKPSYTAVEVGAATPTVVTNIVRDLSLGGIWDAEYEVWWTPRMSGGSLTYHATTNVNMNAGN